MNYVLPIKTTPHKICSIILLKVDSHLGHYMYR
jgi:hypothetical protein